MGRHIFHICICIWPSCFLLIQPTFAQKNSLQDSLTLKNGISKPNTIAAHPLGMLFYNLPHNFKLKASRRPSIDVQLSSGNIWGQPTTTYIPSLPEDRLEIKNIEFYSRIFHFDAINSPSQSYSFEYDGVIKDLRITAILPKGERSDLAIALRSFLLTEGKFPYTLFTGDQFIEFFHSNVAGGEDPFARRIIGLDQARIAYTDRSGQLLEISNKKFVLSGIEISHYHYPRLWSDLDIHLNLGLHLGANLSRYNRSIDLGFSTAAVKQVALSGNKTVLLGLGLNLLRKSTIKFQQNQTDLGTSNLLGSFEGHLEASMKSKRLGFHSIGINYRIQTPYNNKKEEQYYVPFNSDRVGRWHESSRHLYKYSSYWSLIYSFTKKTEFSIYLLQDLLVNNAPDFQTGIRVKLPLSF